MSNIKLSIIPWDQNLHWQLLEELFREVSAPQNAFFFPTEK